MTRCGLASIVILSAGAAFAQVDAPVLGYLPDGAHLRPVYGIPGAATVAPPLELGREFGRIAVSPRQDYSLASDASSGAVLLVTAGGAAAPLAGARVSPDLIVMSPSGASALLWFASDGHAQIVSGLPASPSIREIDAGFTGAGLGDPALKQMPAALAVSDDGQWLAGAWARGAFAIGPNSEVRPLPIDENPRAMAFFAGREDLVLATSSHVLSVTDVGGSATVSVLAEQRMKPLAMGISSDNRRIVVAERSGRLHAFDLRAGTSSAFDCGCTPDGVFAMGRGAMFRFTALANGAFRMLDASKGEILFVPLMAGQGGQQ